MYSRDYGGIRSDGQLYNAEQGYYDDRFEERRSEPDPLPPPVREEVPPRERAPLLPGLRSLRDLKLDDILLIAIGILLLLDSDGENDILTLLVLAMLLF